MASWSAECVSGCSSGWCGLALWSGALVRTDSACQAPSRRRRTIGQRAGHQQPVRVLVQPAVANLHEAEHPLDHPEAALDLCVARLGVERLDHGAELPPRHRRLHFGRERRPARRLAVAVKPSRRQCRLTHRCNPCERRQGLRPRSGKRGGSQPGFPVPAASACGRVFEVALPGRGQLRWGERRAGTPEPAGAAGLSRTRLVRRYLLRRCVRHLRRLRRQQHLGNRHGVQVRAVDRPRFPIQAGEF